MAERVECHNGAEGASADYENDEILKFSAHVSRGGEDVRDDFFLIIGKLRPSHIQFVLASVFFYVGKSGGSRGIVGRKLLGSKSLVAEKFVGHVVVVERNAHVVAPFFGFIAHGVFLRVKFSHYYFRTKKAFCQGLEGGFLYFSDNSFLKGFGEKM